MKKQLILFLVCFLLFGVFSKTLAQVFPIDLISYNSSPDQAINFVVMGDGYKADQQDKFIQDTKRAIDVMFQQEPWLSHVNDINVYAIKVVSNEQGAASDPSELIDNYFGSTFNYAGIERLLVPLRTGKILDVLNSNAPFFDLPIIIVNDSRYGGSGGYFSTFSSGPSSEEVMIHEIGHSFSGLADEYWAGDQYAVEKPNLTQDNNIETNRWKSLLNVNGVGIFSHEESPTWFRPHQNCKMRFLGREFCEVCLLQLNNTIDLYTQTSALDLPIAFFGANKLEILEQNTVNFFDLSTQLPSSWNWSFPGGTPATSNLQNPI
uniref:M64 family metallopeptidase n=1 Tax=Algoriphagus sp. TaxID=1872435 RepID=UPI0025DDCE46